MSLGDPTQSKESIQETLVRVYSQLADRRARCDHYATEVADLTDALDESRAECERLRVIVDAACAVYEVAGDAYFARPASVGEYRTTTALLAEAVAAEVTRRAATK